MLLHPPTRRGQQGLGHPVISHLHGADTGARLRVRVVLPPPFSGSSRPTHPGLDLPRPGLADLTGSPALGAEPGPVEGPGVDDEAVPIRPAPGTPQEGGRRLSEALRGLQQQQPCASGRVFGQDLSEKTASTACAVSCDMTVPNVLSMRDHWAGPIA